MIIAPQDAMIGALVKVTQVVCIVDATKGFTGLHASMKTFQFA